VENIIAARIEVANAGVPISMQRTQAQPTYISMLQGDAEIRISVPDAPILLKQLLHLLSMDDQP
jgi:hypothetical protein